MSHVRPGLRAAIVGAGLMGRWHAQYARRAGAHIAAIIDTSSEAALELQSRFPTYIAPNMAQALQLTEFDAVHICTPAATHVSLAMSALSAGKHVLVEKPLAGTAAEVDALITLAQSRQVCLAVAHQFPFQRGFQQLLSGLPQLGDVVRVTYEAFTAGGDGFDDNQRRMLLHEILPHPLSLVHRILEGRLAADAWSTIDSGVDNLEVAAACGPVRVHIGVNLRGRPRQNVLRVVGTNTTALLDLYHGYGFTCSGPVSRLSKALLPFTASMHEFAAAGVNLASRTWHWEPAYPGLRALIAAFYRSASSSQIWPVNPEEMRFVAQVMQRVRG